MSWWNAADNNSPHTYFGTIGTGGLNQGQEQPPQQIGNYRHNCFHTGAVTQLPLLNHTGAAQLPQPHMPSVSISVGVSVTTHCPYGSTGYIPSFLPQQHLQHNDPQQQSMNLQFQQQHSMMQMQQAPFLFPPQQLYPQQQQLSSSLHPKTATTSTPS